MLLSRSLLLSNALRDPLFFGHWPLNPNRARAEPLGKAATGQRRWTREIGWMKGGFQR